jgi:hypothetical protein
MHDRLVLESRDLPLVARCPHTAGTSIGVEVDTGGASTARCEKESWRRAIFMVTSRRRQGYSERLAEGG